MSDNGKAPGVLSLVAETIRAPFERMAMGHQVRRNDRLMMQAVNNRLAESVSRVMPDNDGFESALLATADRELDDSSAEALRLQAQRASLKSTHMKGYLGSLERFVVGLGPTFTAETEEEGQKKPLQDAIDEWWKLFKALNHWDESLEHEIPHRTWRDGEVFNRFFIQETEGPPDGWEPDPRVMDGLHPKEPFDESELEPPSVPAGMTFVRLIPPEQIRDPNGTVSHGILTAADDVVTPLAYLWAPDAQPKNDKLTDPDDGTLREIIPAKEIQHIKINADQDVKRGRSQLEVLLKRNKQYEDWLAYRILLNLVRSAVVLIKRIVGATAAQVANIKNKYATQRTEGTDTNRSQMLKGGTTIHATEGMEYEMLSANLQAQDAQHDGRSILLSEAAATGLPEFMFTGDASNSNFASTMVAESPAVREFQRWQDFFEPAFREIYRRVLVAGAEAGQIEGLTPAAAATIVIAITWQPLLSRDELDHAKANQLRMSMGILSKEGAAADEGVDWPIEKERLAIERREDVEFTGPMGEPGPEGGDE